jgi:hypothetical protein
VSYEKQFATEDESSDKESMGISSHNDLEEGEKEITGL